MLNSHRLAGQLGHRVSLWGKVWEDVRPLLPQEQLPGTAGENYPDPAREGGAAALS